MDDLLNDNNDKTIIENSTKSVELEYSSDSDYEIKKPLKKKAKKAKKSNLCPGCFPVFQPGQIAHYGPNSCLGIDDTNPHSLIGFDDIFLKVDEDNEPKKKKCKKNKDK
jgi:hypothetical protein